MAQLPALAPLLASQQETHAGQPGGLGQARTPEQRALELQLPEKNRPKDIQGGCGIAPDHPDAHDAMAVFINRIMNHIIASKYFYKEYENQALDWLEDQFKDRGSVQFRLVLRETKRSLISDGLYWKPATRN